MLRQDRHGSAFAQLGEVKQRQIALRVQRCNIEADAGDEQFGKTELQAAQALRAGVEGDCQRIATGENLPGKSGADAARSEFDEDADAGGVHRFDFTDEFDAGQQVLVELLLHRSRFLRIRLPTGVRVDRELR